MYISQNLALNTKSKYEKGFDHEQHKRNENIIHSVTILDVFIIGVKCMKNDQKMIREQFEAFPALLQ